MGPESSGGKWGFCSPVLLSRDVWGTAAPTEGRQDAPDRGRAQGGPRSPQPRRRFRGPAAQGTPLQTPREASGGDFPLAGRWAPAALRPRDATVVETGVIRAWALPQHCHGAGPLLCPALAPTPRAEQPQLPQASTGTNVSKLACALEDSGWGLGGPYISIPSCFPGGGPSLREGRAEPGCGQTGPIPKPLGLGRCEACSWGGGPPGQVRRVAGQGSCLTLSSQL